MSTYNAGDEVGRFRLLGPLGRGGMGEVWRAEHVRTEARYALKIVFRDTGRDEDVFRRFDREVKAAARIGHPGIVEVVDCDVDPRTGCPYLVMELLDGAPLGEWRRGQPPSAVVAVLRNALEPLAAGHAVRGADGTPMPIVHRDLKPDNLFVLHHPVIVPTTGMPQHVKILDFGIARQQGLGDATTGTLGGIGTPGYMSPEQAREAKHVGPESDVFSIGAMLYEAIGGVRPFVGESVAEVIAQLLTAEPRPLLERAPGLDPRVAALVHRCLSKDPATRPADAGALRTELDALLGDPVIARTLDGTPATVPIVAGAVPDPVPALAPTTPFDPAPAPPVAPPALLAPPRRSRASLVVAISATLSLLGLAAMIWAFVSGEDIPLPATPDLVPALRTTEWAARIGSYRDTRPVYELATTGHAALEPDGTLVFMSPYNAGLIVWRWRGGTITDVRYPASAVAARISVSAVAADGAVILGTPGGIIALAEDGTATRVELGSDERPTRIAVSADGRRVAVLSTTGRIFSARLPLTTNGLTRHALLGSRILRTIAFDHAGRIIAGGDAAHVQRETENGGWEALPLPVQGRINAVGWHRSGAILAADEVGNVMWYRRSRWSRLGGIGTPAIAIQDTPTHGVVAVDAQGRMFVLAEGSDFTELAGFNAPNHNYEIAWIWGDNVMLASRSSVLVHTADQRWISSEREVEEPFIHGCTPIGPRDGLESAGTPHTLLDCGGSPSRLGAAGVEAVQTVSLGSVSVPAARLVSLLQEIGSDPYDIAAGAVWRARRSGTDAIVERWDPQHDAWDVVLVNTPTQGRVYRFSSIDVIELPDGSARLWAFDFANDVRVTTVPAGRIERPIAFETVMTDESFRQAVGLQFIAREAELVASTERAYIVYDRRTIVEVSRSAAPRRVVLARRATVTGPADPDWESSRWASARVVRIGETILVAKSGHLYEIDAEGAVTEWTVDDVGVAWSSMDDVLHEGDVTHAVLDGWLVRCSARRCTDAGTYGAVAFTRIERAAPDTLGLLLRERGVGYVTH